MFRLQKPWEKDGKAAFSLNHENQEMVGGTSEYHFAIRKDDRGVRQIKHGLFYRTDITLQCHQIWLAMGCLHHGADEGKESPGDWMRLGLGNRLTSWHIRALSLANSL